MSPFVCFVKGLFLCTWKSAGFSLGLRKIPLGKTGVLEVSYVKNSKGSLTMDPSENILVVTKAL
ncbi:hypothetical protein P3G55_14420 [Leptospira sp. 96542]|nr:hypothetical protein [Leptospira sp. 96542]